MTSLPGHYTTQFGAMWDHLCQQRLSKLRPLVVLESVEGEAKTGNQLGPVEMQPVTQRAGETRITDQPSVKRWLRPFPHDLATLFDENDPAFLGAVQDPTGETVTNHAMAYGRAVDRAIVNAALGTAYTGDTGVTPVSLDSDNVIAVNYGGSNSGLTIAKLLQAKFVLDDNEVPEDESRVIAVSARQLNDLLNTTEVKSADYNTVKALVRGEVDTFLGFTFHRVMKSAFPYNAGTDVRTIPFWARSGIHLADSGKTTHIDILPERSHAKQIRTVARVGASRWDEAKVGAIYCDESP